MAPRPEPPKANRPKSHQLSLVSVTMVGNATAAFYCVKESQEVEKDYMEAKVGNGVLRVETGDRTEDTRESVILIPVEQIMLLAVAKINHIASAHGIITS